MTYWGYQRRESLPGGGRGQPVSRKVLTKTFRNGNSPQRLGPGAASQVKGTCCPSWRPERDPCAQRWASCPRGPAFPRLSAPRGPRGLQAVSVPLGLCRHRSPSSSLTGGFLFIIHQKGEVQMLGLESGPFLRLSDEEDRPQVPGEHPPPFRSWPSPVTSSSSCAAD